MLFTPYGAAVLEALTTFFQPWADVYAARPLLSTAVLVLHMLAMFVGGGMAIAADRRVMLATPGTADAVRAVIADLSTTHSIVVTALVLTIVSGTALFASDVPAFAVSRIFWAKLFVLVALLLNGLRMQRTERAAVRSVAGAPLQTAEMPVPFPQHAWRGVRSAASVSLLLWMSLVVLGVTLANG